MIVEAVHFRGFRGFNLAMAFNPVATVLVGENGSGKTTTLDVIAGMAGTDKATELVAGRKVDFAQIVLRDGVGGETHTLTLEKEFDPDRIDAFKQGLPERVSYTVTEQWGDRYVGRRANPVKAQDRMIRWLEEADLGLSQQLVVTSSGASLLVSETGAQRMLMSHGMRLTAAPVPVLVDHMGQSLHVILRRRVHSFYRQTNQQLICTTHCPDVMAGVEWLVKDSVTFNERDHPRPVISMDQVRV